MPTVADSGGVIKPLCNCGNGQQGGSAASNQKAATVEPPGQTTQRRLEAQGQPVAVQR